MNHHDEHYYKILSRIDGGKTITQRSLSRELGIALGLTNLLVRRLVSKGFVKTAGAIRGRRLQYLLTRKGITEKARLSVAYLENTIHLYTETRERIRQSLRQIAAAGDNGETRQRIVFYGAGEVAEIAYVALDNSMFQLVGVVDDHKSGQRFFGHLIASPDELGKGQQDYDRIVITTFKKSKHIRDRLRNLRVPPHKTSFL